jgi:hypothetical protein
MTDLTQRARQARGARLSTGATKGLVAHDLSV